MGKIIHVDFKKKGHQYTWDDLLAEREKVADQIHDDFHKILDKIHYCIPSDLAYQEHVARTLGGIVYNIKERLKEQ